MLPLFKKDGCVRLPLIKADPTLVELAYVDPIRGKYAGQGRRCGNCILFVSPEPVGFSGVYDAEGQCLVFDPSYPVSSEGVCSYHAPGDPEYLSTDLPVVPHNHDPLNPELAGYEIVGPEGTKCSNCSRFNSQESRCMYARDDPMVDPLGCCNAWKSSGSMIGKRRDGAGPATYDQQSMPDYGEVYGVDAVRDASKDKVEEAALRRRAASARLINRYGFHGEAPGPVQVRGHEHFAVSNPVDHKATKQNRQKVAHIPRKPLKFIIREDMEKASARGGKYYRRVPTGNPKRPFRYYYTKEQYDRSHGPKAHVHGPEVKQERESKKKIKRHWVSGEDYGYSDTQKSHQVNGEYTDARKQFHDRVVKEATEKVRPAVFKPVAIVTMGGPASGKGTVIRHIMGSHDDFVNVDPDEMKQKIPEYKEMMRLGKKGDKVVTAKDASLFAHGESSDIAEKVLSQALSQRSNLILDGTGKSADKHVAKIKRLKEAGYHVRLVMPHIDIDEAKKRMNERADRSGRYVPDKIVDMAHHLIPGNFDKIQAIADEAALFDNTKPPPRVVWSRSGSDVSVHDDEYVSKFRELGKERHRISREKGWLKKGEQRIDLTMEEMLERIRTSDVGTVEELHTGLDDFYEETERALKMSKSYVEQLEELVKGKTGEHPYSESQRRWAFAAEKRGELPKGTAHKWSKRVEGEDLPASTGKATEDLEDEEKDEEEQEEEAVKANLDPNCLIHGRDPAKWNWSEPFAKCSCPS